MAQSAMSPALARWRRCVLGLALLLPLHSAEIRLTLDQLGKRKAPDFSSVHEGKTVVVRGVVSADNSLLYVSNFGSDSVSVYSIQNGKFLKAIAVGSHPAGIAVGAGSVWVANTDGTVSRIDPAAGQGLGRVVRTIAVGGTPSSLAVGAGLVWVTVD